MPAQWRERYGVRRYGFHGTNYAHVTKEAARLLGKDVGAATSSRSHLGNGASACAVRDGVSVDTSMGLTPLAGLVDGHEERGRRPVSAGYLARVAGLGPDAVDDALEHDSGLQGLAGASDMRDVLRRRAGGDADAVARLRHVLLPGAQLRRGLRRRPRAPRRDRLHGRRRRARGAGTCRRR